MRWIKLWDQVSRAEQTKPREVIRRPPPSNRAGQGRERSDIRGELSAGVSDRLSQNGIELLLAEFLGLLPLRSVPRYLPCDWTGTGCRRYRPRLWGRSYLGPCCGRLAAALQAQTGQHAADRVTTAPETARDLRCALSRGPEPIEERYVLRIPAHGKDYSADCQHAPV